MKIKQRFFSRLALGLFIAVSLTVCAGFPGSVAGQAADPAHGPGLDNPGLQKAIQVQNRHTQVLMNIPGVVGHGIGLSEDGQPVIKVFVEKAGIPGLPAVLEGVPTRVEVTGMVVAYADPTAWFERPVPIGVSTGHPDITAGTIGCRVTDGTNVFALSNNHVYANQNNADIGDNVLQPGTYDGGSDPTDAIGYLHDFVPIDFSGADNYMDAAIAFSSADSLGTSTPDDGYGTPDVNIAAASPEQKVQKYGRTTGWTSGTVDTVNTTVNVCFQTRLFRCVKQAKFVYQIGITPGTFSAGGDSGSLIVTDDGNFKPVGLLFAGSNTHTFANRINLVLERFGVTVDNGATPVPPNSPPKADFSYLVEGLMVSFTDKSSDSDGLVEKWDWSFGDKLGTSTVKNPDYTYAASGTYSVTLTVEDDDGASESIIQQVKVTSGDTSDPIISLNATAAKQNKAWRFFDLSWSGATTVNIDIFRDGNKIITTPNDGFHTDKISNTGESVSYGYKVCQEGDETICSELVKVAF